MSSSFYLVLNIEENRSECGINGSMLRIDQTIPNKGEPTMKKIWAGIVLGLLGIWLAVFPAGAIENFQLSYDLAGTFNDSNGGNQESGYGVTIAGETLFEMGSHVTIGYGLEIPFPRNQGDSGDRFSFPAAYATVNLAPTSLAMAPYLFARAGYSYLFYLPVNEDSGDARSYGGGLYTGFGLGCRLGTAQYAPRVEVLYTTASGNITASGLTQNITYSKISLNAVFSYESF